MASAQNTAVLTFPIPSGSWGTVTHFGIWTTSGGGIFLGGDSLNTALIVITGVAPRFGASQLSVTVLEGEAEVAGAVRTVNGFIEGDFVCLVTCWGSWGYWG